MMIFIQLTSNNDGLKNQTLTVVSLTDFLLNGLLEKVRFLFLSEVQSCQTVLQGTTNPSLTTKYKHIYIKYTHVCTQGGTYICREGVEERPRRGVDYLVVELLLPYLPP